MPDCTPAVGAAFIRDEIDPEHVEDALAKIWVALRDGRGPAFASGFITEAARLLGLPPPAVARTEPVDCTPENIAAILREVPVSSRRHALERIEDVMREVYTRSWNRKTGKRLAHAFAEQVAQMLDDRRLH
jgi:hypothetical protein